MPAEQFPDRDLPAAKPFALVDALARRDAAGALLAVHDQLVNGKAPLELLGLVAWQLQRWVIVRRLMDAGHETAHIADVAGVRPWQAQRLESEVGARPLGSLQALLVRCWQLDTDAKRSAVIPQLAVEQLVIEVCQAEAKEPMFV
jgi:DNA polymerase III delta subunit